MSLCLTLTPINYESYFSQVNLFVSFMEVLAFTGIFRLPTGLTHTWKKPEGFLDHGDLYAKIALFLVFAVIFIALAILLVYGIFRMNYYVCYIWLLCEALVLSFILVSFSCLQMYYQPKYTSTMDSRLGRSFVIVVTLHVFVKSYGLWLITAFTQNLHSVGNKLMNTVNIPVDVAPNTELMEFKASDIEYERL